MSNNRNKYIRYKYDIDNKYNKTQIKYVYFQKYKQQALAFEKMLNYFSKVENSNNLLLLKTLWENITLAFLNDVYGTFIQYFKVVVLIDKNNDSANQEFANTDLLDFIGLLIRFNKKLNNQSTLKLVQKQQVPITQLAIQPILSFSQNYIGKTQESTLEQYIKYIKQL